MARTPGPFRKLVTEIELADKTWYGPVEQEDEISESFSPSNTRADRKFTMSCGGTVCFTLDQTFGSDFSRTLGLWL